MNNLNIKNKSILHQLANINCTDSVTDIEPALLLTNLTNSHSAINKNKTTNQLPTNFENPNKSIVAAATSSLNNTKNNSSSANLTDFSPHIQLLGIDNSRNEKNKWPGLALLHSKGSSHTKPNFNLISYNFPFINGSSSSRATTTTKNQTESTFFNLSKLVAAAAASTISNSKNISNIYTRTNYNTNKFIIDNVYKLLFNFFKSMYCLISKPVFIITQDKIKIQLFYFNCSGKYFSLKNIALLNQKNKHNVLNKNNKQNENKVNVAHFTKNSISTIKSAAVRKRVLRTASFFNILTKVYPNKFKLICNILSKFFNKTVELELIRLHKPYYDSNILVNFLSLIVNKKDLTFSIKKIFASSSLNNQFKRMKNINISNKINTNNISSESSNKLTNAALQEKSIQLIDNWFGYSESESRYIPTAAFLSGINIKVSGRLNREAIIPRVTTKKFEKGFTAKGKINYSDISRITSKNRKGAFSITIKSGQNF
jgi:hypothetical protein